MARKIAYISYNLNIQGLYFWGKGWKVEPDPEKPSYQLRWARMCMLLNEQRSITEATDYPYLFRSSVLDMGDSSKCEEFLASGFRAYMHPMDIAGEYISSRYCPSGADEAEEFVTKNMTQLMAIIRKTFPEVEITAQLKMHRYDFDLDRETTPSQFINI